jgi:hypothetical protein
MGGGFLGCWEALSTKLAWTNCFLTLYLISRELIESSSLLDDDACVDRVPFTLDLDSCGSEPRLC